MSALNTFFAQLCGADAANAATQIAPVVEETLKLLPLLFYLAVFEPEPARFRLAAVIVAASFATFENVCYLTQNGAGQITHLLVRGFGTGAMHVICGGVYGSALRPVWTSRPLRAACLFGLLCVALFITRSITSLSPPAVRCSLLPTLFRWRRRSPRQFGEDGGKKCKRHSPLAFFRFSLRSFPLPPPL